MRLKQKNAVVYAILAAVLYGISAPFSKILLQQIPETVMASVLYIGAGAGMSILYLFKNKSQENSGYEKIKQSDYKYVLGMILLDILAPILLMLGLSRTTSANASLLNNFEIVATSIIALVIFKEQISKKMWAAIILITISSIVLSFEGNGTFQFSIGSLYILGGCMCWGLENNCTRVLSVKNPIIIVIIKGFGSGIGSLLVSFLLRQICTNFTYIIFALILGFISYGLSIYYYVKAQKDLGAAKTSAYYAIAPFVGAFVSVIVFRGDFTMNFFVGLIIMIIGTYFAS